MITNKHQEIINAWFNFLFEKIWMYPDVFILPRNYSSYTDVFIYKINGCYIPRWLISNLTRPPQLTKYWLILFVFLTSFLSLLCINYYYLSFPFLLSAKDWFDFVHILFFLLFFSFFLSFFFQITLFIDFISNSTNSSSKKRYVQKASIDAKTIYEHH